MTEKEKQIEEMARYFCLPCELEYCGRCVEGFDPGKCTMVLDAAEALYNAGYRKQIVGEWERREGERWIGSEVCERFYYYSCSICGRRHNLPDSYCPKCGAKMKGGESDA